MGKTFLLECREQAAECQDVLRRHLLRTATDDLEAALKILADDPTTYSMQRANAMWARAARMKIMAENPAPTPPTTGPTEATQSAEAA